MHVDICNGMYVRLYARVSFMSEKMYIGRDEKDEGVGGKEEERRGRGRRGYWE